MKQVLFLLSGCLLLAGSAQAQLGVRAGGSLSSFTKGGGLDGETTTTRRRLGYQAGIFYQIPLTKHLSLVPEAQFSREYFSVSTRVEDIYTLLTSDYTQSLSYLNLPILLRGSMGAFYVEAGPQLSLLVGGRAEGTQEVIGVYSVHQVLPVYAKATDSYRHFDAGACVGVGVKLPAGLGFGLRAYWGLTRLTSNEDFSAYGQTYPSFHHRQTLQASLTYQLHGS